MSFDPSLEEQELLAETRRRSESGLTARETLAAALSAAGFAAVVAAIWVVCPPYPLPVVPMILSLLVLVLAVRIKFDTPLGFTVPTQLAFVPMVFSTPHAYIPIAVAVAFALAMAPEVLTGKVRASRLLFTPSNCWFAIGPTALLAITHTRPEHAGALLLLAALMAQFAVDFASSALRFLIAGDASPTAVFGSSWVYGIDAALSAPGLLAAENIHRTPLAALAMVPLLGLIAIFARERSRRLESMLELSSAYRGTALVLGDVIEADDGYTGQHCKSVVALSLELAEQLRLSPERQRNLEFAALLHDVGKIAIPKEIINKPGKLEPHEWAIIKTHTLEGQKMLDRVGGFMRQVGTIVRSHHERWDGAGYPDGLAGEHIPLEARIIACCDTWNAMRTDRPYRKALPYDVAHTELLSASGTQLDPMIVDGLLQVVAGEARATAEALEAEALSRDAGGARRPQPAYG